MNVCKICKTGNHTLNAAPQIATSDVLQKRLQEAMRNTTRIPSPWIFAPGAVPLQPPINSGPLNGIIRHDHGKLETAANSGLTDDALRHGLGEAPFGSPPLHDIKHSVLQQQALTFEDKYSELASDPTYTGKRSGDPRGMYRQSSPGPNPSRQSPPSSVSKSAVSPVQLANSAPNGGAPLEFGSHRLPNGIRSMTSPQSAIPQPRLAHSPQPVHSTNDQEHAQAGASSMLGGSFPGTSLLSGNHSYDLGAPSNHNDVHQHDVFRKSDAASSAIPVDHPLPASKTGINTAMEELALGSYEAVEPRNRLAGNSRRAIANPIVVPGSIGSDEAPHNEVTSLQALAAASDAANGGTGSATQESLRAVCAVVTPGRNQSGKQSRTNGVPNGTYNMF